jgi:hypothetical protein
MPSVVKLANHIANTEFVPKGLRGKPAAVAAAILAGRESGIGPMTALQHMNVIDGRPAMSAELKRARALAAGHDIVYEETSTQRCVVKGRRKGDDNWTTVTWSMDDARNAKLVNKDNWRLYPRRMLQARAIGELCDLIFPDTTAGLPTIEEVTDGGEFTEVVGTAEAKPAAKGRTAKRATKVTRPPAESGKPPVEPAPSKAPSPPLPGEDENTPAASRVARPSESSPPGEEESRPASRGPTPIQRAPDGITQPMLTKSAILFNELGWTERADRLDAITAIINRKVESTKDLTKEEGMSLIDTLDRLVSSSGSFEQASARLGELVNAAIIKTVSDSFEGAEVVDAEVVDTPAPTKLENTLVAPTRRPGPGHRGG